MTLSARKGTRDVGGQALPGTGGFTPPLLSWGRKGGKQRRVPAPLHCSWWARDVPTVTPLQATAEHVAQPRCQGRARVAQAMA